MSPKELTFRNLPPGLTSAQVQAHDMAPAHLQNAQFSIYPTVKLNYPPPLVQERFRAAPKLDLAAFGVAIHAQLKDSAMGYILQVRHHGDLVHTGIWNWAQTPADHGVGWTEDTRMHVASVSKFLTAVALVKVLSNKNSSCDEKIGGYLPTYWSKGPFIDQITFRNLMTHTSGLVNEKALFGNMKSRVAAGVSYPPYPSGRWFFRYSDINFGLCRILIPILNGDLAKDEAFGMRQEGKKDQAWSAATLHLYSTYMQAEVFGPAGVDGATLTPTRGRSDALAYKSPQDNPGGSEKGYDSGDCSAVAGPVGWRLSTKELLDVMSHVRRKNTIIGSRETQDLLDNFFGIDYFGCFGTPAGKMYSKSGFFADGDQDGRRGECVAYFLPNAMEAAVFVNSPIGEDPLFVMVRDAFMNSLSD